MKFTCSPVSLCRTPIFSTKEELHNVWDELKSYIKESSPDFFEIIKHKNYNDFESLEPKIKFTIWKYFNRAKFRATPYGNFAAFSLIPLKKGNLQGPVTLSKKHIAYRLTSWQEKENINPDPKWLSKHSRFLRANTTTYKCANELRFINVDHGTFELSAVELEETIIATLEFCNTQRSLEEVHIFLKQNIGLNKSDLNYFLEQLIEIQLLVTDFQPNITGSDYFTRIGYPYVKKDIDYIISERELINGNLPENRLQVLSELIIFLSKHAVQSSNTSLAEFRNKFSKRFERDEIPLLLALDPETGIGYNSLEHDKEENHLIQELKENSHKEQSQEINYTPLYQFILNQLIDKKTVQLHDFKGIEKQNPLPLSNTNGFLLSYSNEHIILDKISGCTANSLLGRFTIASEEITNLCRGFASKEEEANPGVLFFDVAYQNEKQTDNVNRRKSVYNYELPILSWSESKQIIDLNDIMISIKGDELVLHSLKYSKRIIPRFASAYNYTRSDLAVYRFLSDLQTQNLNSYLGISMTRIFPGLSHYQRVQYKNVILSPEKWLVPQHICTQSASDKSLDNLNQWLTEIGLSQPFKCGKEDQTLLFNPAVTEELSFFLLFCKNKTAFYIEETFISDIDAVNDENNQPYLPEFIINLEHKEQLYKPYPLKQTTREPAEITQAYLPGEEWIYYEIYSHPSRINSILLHLAADFIGRFKKKIKNWFFVRYNDPSFHIRFRVQLKNTADSSLILSFLSELFKPYLQTGLIEDVQIKTYRRETQRYGAKRMILTEEYFSINSDYILSLLAKQRTTNDLYQLSLSLIENVFHEAGITLHEQLVFAENLSGNFAAEMNIQQEGFKKINIAYKEFQASQNLSLLNKTQSQKAVKTEACLLKVLALCTSEEKPVLLADLFHMHTNRLFENDQRMHEMIMYNYLIKRVKMKIARLRQQN